MHQYYMGFMVSNNTLLISYFGMEHWTWNRSQIWSWIERDWYSFWF